MAGVPKGVPTVELKGLDAVMTQIAVLTGAIRNPGKHFKEAVPHFVGAIKRNFEAGGRPTKWKVRLNWTPSNLHKSGHLIASIHGRVEGDTIRIGPSTGVAMKYAAIHQFGGQTKAHKIKPKHGKFLAFLWPMAFSGQTRQSMTMGKYTKRKLLTIRGVTIKHKVWKSGDESVFAWVQHPGSKIPARPYLVITDDEKIEGVALIAASMQMAIDKAAVAAVGVQMAGMRGSGF